MNIVFYWRPIRQIRYTVRCTDRKNKPVLKSSVREFLNIDYDTVGLKLALRQRRPYQNVMRAFFVQQTTAAALPHNCLPQSFCLIWNLWPCKFCLEIQAFSVRAVDR